MLQDIWIKFKDGHVETYTVCLYMGGIETLQVSIWIWDKNKIKSVIKEWDRKDINFYFFTKTEDKKIMKAYNKMLEEISKEYDRNIERNRRIKEGCDKGKISNYDLFHLSFEELEKKAMS